MKTNNLAGSVPEWLIERLAAGELPPARAREIEQRLEGEPDGKERLARIAASNAEILAAHPPEAVTAEIRRRATEAKRRASAAANAKRSTWVLAIPALAAAAAILVLWIRPPRPVEGVTQGHYEGIKGAQRSVGLRVYRKAGKKVERLSEGAPARAGDELQLAYVAAGHAFGAVLSLDGAGRVTFHMPEGGGKAAELKAGEVTLPQSYQLDAAPVFERFLIIAGDAPFDTTGLADVVRGVAKPPAGTETFAFTVRRSDVMSSRLRMPFHFGLLFIFSALMLFAAVAAAAPAPTAPGAGHQGTVVRRFALITGASKGGAGRLPLRYAASDARAMQHVLTELGGIGDANTILLLDVDRSRLREGFERLRRLVAAAGGPSGRTEIVFYYSGHSDEAGLLLGDERVSYQEVRAWVEQTGADVRIAVLDSCASGALTRAKGGVHRPPFLVDTSSAARGHAYLTASSENEAAQESDRVGAAYFTHYLVSGLRGAADVSRDGRVTLSEAYQYAFTETLARTETSRGGPQHASYDFQLTGKGDLVMTDLHATSASLVFPPELSGRLFVRDSTRAAGGRGEQAGGAANRAGTAAGALSGDAGRPAPAVGDQRRPARRPADDAVAPSSWWRWSPPRPCRAAPGEAAGPAEAVAVAPARRPPGPRAPSTCRCSRARTPTRACRRATPSCSGWSPAPPS